METKSKTLFSHPISFVLLLALITCVLFQSTIDLKAGSSDIYVDNFDGANDTNSLKSRGYLVWYRGTGPQGTYATWIQGIPTTFPAYNGPSNGYVASSDHVATGTNDIDCWLVFPRVSGGINAGDTLYFYERSPLNSQWADSLRVMYSANDSIPEGTWVELGRFKTTTTGSWFLRSYGAPSTSVNGRFAIRYCIVNGGPTGQNSVFAGIDAAKIVRDMTSVGNNNNNKVPDNYALEQNYPNPFNPVTTISYSIPEAKLVTITIYDIFGRKVGILVNQYQQAGKYNVSFDGTSFSSGIYFYKMEAGDFNSSRKLTIIK